MFEFSQLSGKLVCPDDGRSLRFTPGSFTCRQCGRVFPILQGRVLELLPSSPARLINCAGGGYSRAYEEEFCRPLRLCDAALPWGAPEAQPAAWLERRQRQVEAILPLLSYGQDTARLLLCDVSAGAGLYTFAYAPYFRGVLHCDLCVDSLAYALAQARQAGVGNILFLRIDYLRPPFEPGLDRVLCLDSLIRGPEHERLLLQALCRMLAPRGFAVVDFHNWWHNPLRRLGLLRQNFGKHGSYSNRQVRRLLASVGIVPANFLRFVQELNNPGGGWRQPARFLLPATRLVYTFGRPASTAPGSASPGAASRSS